MAYLVHHTLSRSGTYAGGKRNPLPIHGSSPKDKSQYKQKPETNNQHFFPFKTNGKRYGFKCPMHGIINGGEIEGAYFGRVRSMF